MVGGILPTQGTRRLAGRTTLHQKVTGRRLLVQTAPGSRHRPTEVQAIIPRVGGASRRRPIGSVAAGSSWAARRRKAPPPRMESAPLALHRGRIQLKPRRRLAKLATTTNPMAAASAAGEAAKTGDVAAPAAVDAAAAAIVDGDAGHERRVAAATAVTTATSRSQSRPPRSDNAAGRSDRWQPSSACGRLLVIALTRMSLSMSAGLMW
mmetsp:Transcript_31508/g.86745  ORF Transcript_31508/g.86745 Transcript_31508/m.86745 type:complete len:208 (-) Transcript_31508:6-629(-)